MPATSEQTRVHACGVGYRHEQYAATFQEFGDTSNFGVWFGDVLERPPHTGHLARAVPEGQVGDRALVYVEASRARCCDGGRCEVDPDKVKVVREPQSRKILAVAAANIEPARLRGQSFGHAVSDRHDRLGLADEPTYKWERSRTTPNAAYADVLNRLVRRILASGVEQQQIIDDDAWVLENESARAADIFVNPRCAVQNVAPDDVGLMVVPTTERAVCWLGSRCHQISILLDAPLTKAAKFTRACSIPTPNWLGANQN
jgi:hypothetical protein